MAALVSAEVARHVLRSEHRGLAVGRVDAEASGGYLLLHTVVVAIVRVARAADAIDLLLDQYHQRAG